MAGSAPSGIMGDPRSKAELPAYAPFNTVSSLAPSRKDIVDTLTAFFGNPAQPEKLVNYTDHHAATYQLPDAFMGSSSYLRDTIKNLVTKSPQSWQTNVALPFRALDTLTIKWDKMDFDVRILQRIPYEGASRLQTSIKRSFRERVVRRGIAMMVESDFYRTPQGIQYFLDQVKSIQYCVQETCNYDCMFALITCFQHDFHYDLRHSLVSNRNIMGALRHEIEMFAVLNKEERGLDLAIEKTRQRLARYGVNPNLMVTVPETMLYLNMVPESMRSYSERGERGPANFDSYNGAQLPPSFRGLSLYTSQPFDAGDDGKVQLLRRNTQIGEFYVMAPPPFWDSSSNKGALPETYMDVLIYDEEADRMVHIPFRDALAHACLPQVANSLKGRGKTLKGMLMLTNTARADILNNMVVSSGGDTTLGAAKYAEFVAAIEVIDTGGNGVPKALQDIAGMVQDGIWIPLRIVITRPFIEHEMFSAIMMVGGADTGNTLLGPSDFQVSANTTVKTIEGYACSFKPAHAHTHLLPVYPLLTS